MDESGQLQSVEHRGTQGDHFFVGGYPAGFLLDWDPARTWVPTEIDKSNSNPRFLTQCTRPSTARTIYSAHPDGKTLVLAGTPGYGYTGGGLLFWDRANASHVLLTHTDIIPEHSTMAPVVLDGGKLLGGTTTAAGTGGEKKAQQAELYVLDMATKKLEWHEVIFPGVQEYTAMCPGPKGMVYGMAEQGRFFVFDPTTRKVVHEEVVSAKFGSTVHHQGPRVFATDQDGATISCL